MKCPACGLNNPDDAVNCDCGHNFTIQAKPLYRSLTYMGLWGFFSNSWRTFGVAWKTFLLLGAIYTLVSWGSGFTPEGVLDVVGVVITAIVTIVTYIAFIKVANKASEGEAIGIGESYSLPLRLLGQFIWTSILYFLICLGGLILLIIPGIIWAARYVLAPYVVIVEGISGREALSRSAVLSKDKTSNIFFNELGFGLLFFLVVTIPFALFTWLVAILLGLPFPTDFSIGPFSIFTMGLEASILQTPEWAEAIGEFGTTIWETLYVIFNVLLFKSLRSLHEFYKAKAAD